jgi:hypothetical protein
LFYLLPILLTCCFAINQQLVTTVAPPYNKHDCNKQECVISEQHQTSLCSVACHPPRYLHNEHHKYNKEHTLSPFAGLAFHPLDGMLQAVPYTFTLLFCPMHFLTHEILLFFTGVWTTNIHDCLHAKVRVAQRVAQTAEVAQ